MLLKEGIERAQKEILDIVDCIEKKEDDKNIMGSFEYLNKFILKIITEKDTVNINLFFKVIKKELHDKLLENKNLDYNNISKYLLKTFKETEDRKYLNYIFDLICEDIDEFSQKNIHAENGDKILTKILNINITDINDIKKYNFTKSNILYYFLNNKEIIKVKYNSILINIYKIINDGTKIIKNSKLNIKTIKKLNNGFCYLEDLGISYQRIDSNKCLLEIINQCIENKITLIMKIKLNDESTININF